MPTTKYCILKTEWASLPNGSKPHSYGEPFSKDIDFEDNTKAIKNSTQVNKKLITINANKKEYSVFQ